MELRAADPAGTALLVVSADTALLERILAVTASAGLEPAVLADPATVRPLWSGASIVIVGVDLAEQLAGLVLPPRLQVYLVADDERRDDACSWSAPLGAAVVALPAGVGLLAAAVTGAGGHRGGGRVLGVVGGCGGVGASTLAAGLAVVAADRGLKTLLVDADPLSGGLDLLLGAERVEGWRWPRLVSARGSLGDLAGQLPRSAGVDVLSAARGEPTTGLPAAAIRAVLTSALRSHDLVIVDLSRDLPPVAREALLHAHCTLLLAAADLRGAAAARQVRLQLVETAADLRLVVRSSQPLALDSRLVSSGLGLPLLATVADDPTLRGGVERADPPGRVSRGPLARACRKILDGVNAAEAA
ncbi:septum formation initiator [Microlunatus panaciterrae]|uniref:Secretion/DNA translocation related CpaE-like protein n=1 Tax=Microlunatus panaciterrae TaxID=400768 RepID=A0ABS2RL56_9ACTN|nr:septum site-determining protein Ssd [Microlunatus panaciterrae]MBM7799222.1 secretion/DNA translocation related CpaE-like protein [Microlunatus panaciterrae]